MDAADVAVRRRAGLTQSRSEAPMARAAKPRSMALRPGDEDLALELLRGRLIREPKLVAGHLVPDRNGRIVGHEYIEEGSDREARAAMERVLHNANWHPLSPALLISLASLLSSDSYLQPRQLVFKNRKGGEQPNYVIDMHIAGDIAAAKKAGGSIDAAKGEAAERYGVDRSTVSRAWKKHRSFFLPDETQRHTQS
jgi:hypothetical protein